MSSESTLVGLMAVGLVGGVAGAWVTAWLLRSVLRGDREMRARSRRVVLCRWQSAHRGVHRSARSLVIALRALEQESIDSPLHGLRVREAQRGRDRWHDALLALDRAEDELVAILDAVARRTTVLLPCRVTDQSIARASSRDRAAIEELMQTCDECDRVVSSRLRELSYFDPADKSVFSPVVSGCIRFVRGLSRMLDHWVGPPER